jgi:hypothetical protein
MIARILGAFFLFVSALPVAMHLDFLPFEMWGFATLVGCASYLFSIPQQTLASATNSNSE